MEHVAIASSHQRLTTNQRVMSRFDAVRAPAVSALENCRRLPQSVPHTYPEHPHGEAEQTRRKEAKRPTCSSYLTTSESKSFAPRAGLLHHAIEHRNLCRSLAPRRMAAIARYLAHASKVVTAGKLKERRLRPGAGLLRGASRARSAQCRRLRHISCASLAASGRSITPFSVTM
jgi:hypothetical protein